MSGVWGAALFDLDGTLVNSEPASQAAYRACFTARGWNVDPEVYRHFSGRRGVDVFAQLHGPWSGEDPDALSAEVLSYLDHRAHPPAPLPGAVELIRSLHARDVPIALVTSAHRTWAEHAVGELLGVRECFSVLVTREDTVDGKPDPAPYLTGLRLLNALSDNAVVLEDTVPGIRSARAAGIGRVIGISTGFDERTLRDAGAHHVVSTLAGLP